MSWTPGKKCIPQPPIGRDRWTSSPILSKEPPNMAKYTTNAIKTSKQLRRSTNPPTTASWWAAPTPNQSERLTRSIHTTNKWVLKSTTIRTSSWRLKPGDSTSTSETTNSAPMETYQRRARKWGLLVRTSNCPSCSTATRLRLWTRRTEKILL